MVWIWSTKKLMSFSAGSNISNISIFNLLLCAGTCGFRYYDRKKVCACIASNFRADFNNCVIVCFSRLATYCFNNDNFNKMFLILAICFLLLASSFSITVCMLIVWNFVYNLSLILTCFACFLNCKKAGVIVQKT